MSKWQQTLPETEPQSVPTAPASPFPNTASLRKARQGIAIGVADY